jgi:hypothetical protein
MIMAEQGANKNNNNNNNDDDVVVEQEVQSKEVVAHAVSSSTTTTSSSSPSSSSFSHSMSTPAAATRQESQEVEHCVEANGETTASSTTKGDDCFPSTEIPKTVNHGEEVHASTIANGDRVIGNAKTNPQHSVRDDNENNNKEDDDEKAPCQVTNRNVDTEKVTLEDEARFTTTTLPPNEPMVKSDKGCVPTTQGRDDEMARFKTFCVPRNDIPENLLLEHALSATASLEVVPTTATTTTTGWGEASTTRQVETGERRSSSHPAPASLAVAVPLALAIPDAVEYNPNNTANRRNTSANHPPSFLFQNNRRRRIHWYGALFGCALVGALTAGLVVFGILQQQQDLTRPGGDGTPLSTMAPTAYREAHIQQQLQHLLLMGVGGIYTNETTTTTSTSTQTEQPTSPWVLDPTTPLYQALYWILDHDPRHVDPDDPFLNQRFLLALFYFSTSQQGPWLSCNPEFTVSSESSSALSLETINSNTTNGNNNDSINDGDFCIFQALIDVFPHRYNSIPSSRWLTGQHECKWAGVQCDDFDRVKGLELSKYITLVVGRDCTLSKFFCSASCL